MATKEELMENAIYFLTENGDTKAANILKESHINDYFSTFSLNGDQVTIDITVPYESYQTLKDTSNPIRKAMENAFRSIISSDAHLDNFRIRTGKPRSSNKKIPAGILNVTELNELIN